ncbi:uncharacterized protein METZ01_LOCUS457909 [marine metagenome]|uniref:Uncharacterized protein n=1 Tax=marine metagenome TaxID=408172 RepID=A0A383ACZ3_9ZZZZ
MGDEYMIVLTRRQLNSLSEEGLQGWLVGAEGEGHPYWTHTVAEIVGQILSQAPPVNNNSEDERQTTWV